jgi:hypothetical protein
MRRDDPKNLDNFYERHVTKIELENGEMILNVGNELINIRE